ncbi:unnamed protein product [Miscanthus lutarioriparius]|uniref:Auxin-responsive protein n=1 Tax=Miscanthus lutarioriparius TaxID=422564 RepID=A0A811S457_9POAL|nr:unnamed protein product [Miscanthus lutarioriparius]
MAATSGSVSRWVLWGGVDQNDHGSCDDMIPYTIWELPLLQASEPSVRLRTYARALGSIPTSTLFFPFFRKKTKAQRETGQETAAAPPHAGAPVPRVWAKGTAAAHPGSQCGNQIAAKFSEVICKAAPPTPTSSSSSPVPRLTLRLGLSGSESSDRNWDCCEDVAAALSLGPLPAAASAGISAKRAFPDPAQRPGAVKASDDKQASPLHAAGRQSAVGGMAPHVELPEEHPRRKRLQEQGAGGGGRVQRRAHDIYLACDFNGQSGLHKSSRKDRLTNGSKVDALKDQDYVLTYDDKDADWMLVSDLLEEHRGKEMRGLCYPALCRVSCGH